MYTENNIKMYRNRFTGRGSGFSRINRNWWQALVKLISLESVKEANNFLSNIAAQKNQLVIWSVGKHSLEKLILRRDCDV